MRITDGDLSRIYSTNDGEVDMAQQFMWGQSQVPMTDVAVQLEKFAEFMLAHNIGPVTQNTFQNWFEPGGLIHEVTYATYANDVRRLTSPPNMLTHMVQTVKPMLEVMERKGYAPEAAEFREFFTRLGEWDAPKTAAPTALDREIDSFTQRGFPALAAPDRPKHRPRPTRPYGPYYPYDFGRAA